MTRIATGGDASLATGPFGRGGERLVRMRFRFHGILGTGFSRFARSRIKLLGLSGWISCGLDEAVIQVEGPEALVGAFEVACCIGPDECDVEHWDGQELTPPASAADDESSRHDRVAGPASSTGQKRSG